MPLTDLDDLTNGIVYGSDQTNVVIDRVNFITDGDPAGGVQQYVGTAEPDGWKFLNGQTLTAAASAYPNLWAVAPAAWKSGSNLVLPDAGEKVLGGFKVGSGTHATIGGTTGDNAKTLAAGNIPAHTHSTPAHAHSIAHDHGSVTSGVQSADHTHGISGTTSGQSASHNHHASPTGTANFLTEETSGGTFGFSATTGSETVYRSPSTQSQSNDHTHTYSGTSGGISANHTHAVDLPNYTGNTDTSGAGTSGSTGSGTSFDVTPATLVLVWMLRCY